MTESYLLDVAGDIVVVENCTEEQQKTVMGWQKFRWNGARNIWKDSDKRQG